MDPVGIVVVTLFALGTAAALGAPFVLSRIIRPPQRVPHYGTRMRACPFDMGRVSLFLDAWLALYALKFGADARAKARAAINALDAYWLDVEFWTIAGGRRVAGETVKPTMIKVASGGRWHSLGGCALAHELCHVALWRINGDPDSDHKGDRYQGWTADHDWIIAEMAKRFS